MRRALTSSGLAVVNAPFREYVWYFLWAIQTFSCGGSFARAFGECDPNVSVRRIEASFQERTVQSRHSLRLPLSLGLALVAMFTALWGHPWIASFVA